MHMALDKESMTPSNAGWISNFPYLPDHLAVELNFFIFKWSFGVMVFFKISFNEILFAYTIHHFF